jgi:hypothetical protein
MNYGRSPVVRVVAWMLSQIMLATLSEEDFEIAAQSSYAYWLASLSDQPPTQEQRLRMATREARRFLFGNAYEKAIDEFHQSIKYRKVSVQLKCWGCGVACFGLVSK